MLFLSFAPKFRNITMKYLSILAIILISALSLSAQSLIHYWHFNTVNGTIETVAADFFSTPEAPVLTYEAAYPNVVNQGYMDDVAGTTLNNRLAEPAGNGIRPRNPSDSMHLTIELPTTGFENIKLSYATQRSGQGMLKQVLYYTTDGETFTQFGDTVLVTTIYELVEFDFSGISGIDNNDYFGIKLLFYEQNVAANGNNRFDNIALEGDPLPVSEDVIHYWHFNGAAGIFDSIAADVFSGADAPYIIYEKAFPIVNNPGYMDDVSGTTVNTRFETPAGNGIRPRNPSDSMQLVMQLPTTGFKDIKLSYATQRSGSGMLKQVLYYTTDGINYTQHGDTVFVTTNYELAGFDFTGLPDVDNNPHFEIKLLFYEQNIAANGNNRFDNVVLEGIALDNQVTGVIVSPSILNLQTGETAQLTATLIPAGAANQEVSWHSLNENIASVNSTGLVTAVADGSTAIVVTTADGGFTDTAFADVLTIYSLSLLVSGMGNPVEGAEVVINSENAMTDVTGLAEFFLAPGIYEVSIFADLFESETFNLELAADTLITISLVPSQKILIHYWHFNDLPDGIIESDRVPADITFSGTSIPEIIYQGPGEGYLDDYSPGTSIGAKENTPGGKALRVRNPSDERELIIQLPTFNFENVELSFAVHRSGSGMLINHIDYTLDGETFFNTGLIPNQINITESYVFHQFDFSEIQGVNNNSKFAVRITYEGNTMQSNGNNRYDNVALIGNLVSSVNIPASRNNFTVYPNPSAGSIHITAADITATEMNFAVYNMTGQLVVNGVINTESEIHFPVNLPNGVYILQIEHDGNKEHQMIMLSR